MLLRVFQKEIRHNFAGLTAYIVIGIFVITTGLFLWVIPGNYNVPDAGYANTDGLFYLAPWLFLFLCPAITMKSIAEEKSQGTWESLISRPVTLTDIILGKYLASWFLVLIALLPAFFYFISVWLLAVPTGNIDTGAFLGSFLGLLLLAGVYLSIGMMASSLTSNQLIAFIIALLICFLMYYGFELLSMFFYTGTFIIFLQDAGIHAHYQSISRGVIDSDDLIYFCLLTGFFLMFSLLILKYKK